MINLLPPEVVKELRATRTNTMLRKYLITSILALVVVATAVAGAFYINQQNLQAYQQEREESRRELASLSEVKKRIAEYNGELKVAESAIKNEARMSVLIANLSSVLPPGSVLSGIAFNVESLEEPAVIQAQVDSFNKAGVLKRNFDQSEFFTEVVLQQVSRADGEDEAPSAYPFNVQLQVTLDNAALQAANPESEAL